MQSHVKVNLRLTEQTLIRIMTMYVSNSLVDKARKHTMIEVTSDLNQTKLSSQNPQLTRKTFRLSKERKREMYQRIEELITRGVTNQQQIATAMNVSQPTVSRAIKILQKQMVLRDRTSLDTKRSFRVQQLGKILQIAIEAFDRSIENETEVTTQSRLCRVCEATGNVSNEKDDRVKCSECAGTGEITITTHKSKRKSGDSSFLKVCVDCVREIGRMEGSYVDKSSAVASVRRLIAESKETNGVIEKRVEELYIDVPVDLILRAKQTIDELRESGSESEQNKIEHTKSERKFVDT